MFEKEEPFAGASLQLVPITMELVALIKNQRLYLIVDTSFKKRASRGQARASRGDRSIKFDV